MTCSPSTLQRHCVTGVEKHITSGGARLGLRLVFIACTLRH